MESNRLKAIGFFIDNDCIPDSNLINTYILKIIQILVLKGVYADRKNVILEEAPNETGGLF
jgi:hypothetical protein